MFETILNQLLQDEVLSPLAFLIFGGLGLAWFHILRFFSREFMARNAEHPLFRNTFERFESRTRLSWILIGVGTLWLAQTLFQQTWAAGL